MAAGIEAELLDLLVVFILAASVIGVELGIELSHDLILLVLLPPLLFEGAATTDLEQFRGDLVPILALAVPGLVLSIVVLGYLGQYAFGFPLVVALLLPRPSSPPTPSRCSRCSTSWARPTASPPSSRARASSTTAWASSSSPPCSPSRAAGRRRTRSSGRRPSST